MAFIPIETWWRVSVNVSSCHLSQMAFALSQLNIPFSEISACWRKQSRESIDGTILGFYISPLAAAAQPWIPVSWTGSSSKLPPTDRRSELNIGQFVSFIEVLLQQASMWISVIIHAHSGGNSLIKGTERFCFSRKLVKSLYFQVIVQNKWTNAKDHIISKFRRHPPTGFCPTFSGEPN